MPTQIVDVPDQRSLRLRHQGLCIAHHLISRVGGGIHQSVPGRKCCLAHKIGVHRARSSEKAANSSSYGRGRF
jgi:hypothetical protein